MDLVVGVFTGIVLNSCISPSPEEIAQRGGGAEDAVISLSLSVNHLELQHS